MWYSGSSSSASKITCLELYCADSILSPENIHDQVIRELYTLKMSDGCLKRKINIFGEDLPGPIIDDFTASLGQTVSVMRKQNAAAFIRNKSQDFISSEYQKKGVAHYYETANRNMIGAENMINRTLTKDAQSRRAVWVSLLDSRNNASGRTANPWLSLNPSFLIATEIIVHLLIQHFREKR